MKITAENFSKQPALAYRKAEKGEEVTINHNRYPGVVFILSARERGEAMREDYEEINNNTALINASP